jgi:hypothetical protein
LKRRPEQEPSKEGEQQYQQTNSKRKCEGKRREKRPRGKEKSKGKRMGEPRRKQATHHSETQTRARTRHGIPSRRCGEAVWAVDGVGASAGLQVPVEVATHHHVVERRCGTTAQHKRGTLQSRTWSCMRSVTRCPLERRRRVVGAGNWVIAAPPHPVQPARKADRPLWACLREFSVHLRVRARVVMGVSARVTACACVRGIAGGGERAQPLRLTGVRA